MVKTRLSRERKQECHTPGGNPLAVHRRRACEVSIQDQKLVVSTFPPGHLQSQSLASLYLKPMKDAPLLIRPLHQRLAVEDPNSQYQIRGVRSQVLRVRRQTLRVRIHYYAIARRTKLTLSGPRRSMHDSLHNPALYRDAISPPPILEFLRATDHSQPAPVINDEDAMSRSDRPRARRTRSRNSQLSRSTKNSGAASVADSQDTARYARAPKSEKGSTRSSRPPSSTNPSTIRSSTSDSEEASSFNQEHRGSGRTSTQSSPPPSPGPSRPKGNPRASSAADGGKENSYVYQGKTHVIHKRGGKKENAQRPPSRSSRHSQAASLAGEKEDTRSVRSNNRSERGSEAGSQRRRSPIRLRGPSLADSRRGAPSVTGEEEDTRSVRSSRRNAGIRREMGMVVYDKKKNKNAPPSDQRR